MNQTSSPGRLDDEIERTLLDNRRIFFSEDVNHASATAAIRKLWYLELKDPGKPILLVINSPGGSVDAGFAVWDQTRMIRSPISTLLTGLAASMGSILGQCAPRGRRFATPNCRILIHQPAIQGAIHGQATDLEIQAREILKTRDRIIDLYSETTGKDRDTIAAAIERDSWFSPQEAQNFGLIDQVVASFDDIPPYDP
ncbi:MAG: ATP-dependent Clp protease proteolytic subunit [Myxococcales bacterium]|nr:ATP-dependent Clp protease proteolytic subunit [Myxococcales bacterium]